MTILIVIFGFVLLIFLIAALLLLTCVFVYLVRSHKFHAEDFIVSIESFIFAGCVILMAWLFPKIFIGSVSIVLSCLIIIILLMILPRISNYFLNRKKREKLNE